MKEANIFEAWADRLMEGTWQTPDTPEKQAELVELLSKDLPVGADATNATEQLYGLMGDDVLFDQLEELARRDANADARQVVLNRMQELSDDPDVMKVITSLNIDSTAEMNPPEQTPADLEQPVAEELTDGEDSFGGDAADELIRNVEVQQDSIYESRMLDEDGSKLEHIISRFPHEVRNFEQGGDLDEKLYDALFDYYFSRGDIPYGVAKARDGDPHEWVANNLESHLRGGGLVGGAPEEDYAIERESKDPATQTEDPPGTQQPAFPEYQQDLESILKHAGVPAKPVPAPDYELGVTAESSDMEEAENLSPFSESAADPTLERFQQLAAIKCN